MVRLTRATKQKRTPRHESGASLASDGDWQRLGCGSVGHDGGRECVGLIVQLAGQLGDLGRVSAGVLQLVGDALDEHDRRVFRVGVLLNGRLEIVDFLHENLSFRPDEPGQFIHTPRQFTQRRRYGVSYGAGVVDVDLDGEHE